MDTWIEEASMMIFIEAAAERRFNKTLSVERIAEIINREFNRNRPSTNDPLSCIIS
jgi:hypothetical protein